MSDHGHFTIRSPPQSLIHQGLADVDEISITMLLAQPPLSLTAPECVVAENAGGVMIYVQNPSEIDRVAAWLMAQAFVGPVVSLHYATIA